MPVDLRHLWRNLHRSPGSAAAAVLTLALTLGAGASIFAVVNAYLLTPPPFLDPAALVTVGEMPIAEPDGVPRVVSSLTFERWRERSDFEAVLEAFDATNVTLTGLGAAHRVSATHVTPGFFRLLGISPALGRTFTAADVGQPRAVISDGFWHDRLGADPGAIGQSITLGGRAVTIVGVLPPQFVFALNPSEIWLPFRPPAGPPRVNVPVRVVARLLGGLTAADLEDMLSEISRNSSPPSRAVATPIALAIVGDARGPLRLLAGAAGLVIALAFMNLTVLLIVRAIDRRRELAIRLALGARRREVARQLLLEVVAIVVMGITGGLLLAHWGTPVAARLALEQFGNAGSPKVVLNWRLVYALTALAMVCGGICGAAPAWFFADPSGIQALGRGSTAPTREMTWRRLLVSAEVALAFVLVTGVTLVGGSLFRLLRESPGFDPEGVTAMQVSLPVELYRNADRVAVFYGALQSALDERLGGRAISLVSEIPLTGDGGRRLLGLRPDDLCCEAAAREAGDAYFEVMRIPVVAGRSFDGRDGASAPRRVIVSEALRTRLFPTGNGVGRQLWLSPTVQAEIVGVVGDVKHRTMNEALLPTVYFPMSQSPSRSVVLVARGTRPTDDLIGAVREAVGRLDSNVPVYRIQSMRDVVANSPGMAARRATTVTLGSFGLLALVLSMMGLFGVVTHDVAFRRRELALRIALGAAPGRITVATLGRGALMIGAGLAAGGLLSLWAVEVLRSAGVVSGGLDALSVAMSAAALVVAGLAATLPSARRAARTDPMIVLRGE